MSKRILIIPIPEEKVKSNYKIGQEINYYDNMRQKQYYAKIINILPDCECLNINIFAEIIEEQELIENEINLH